MPVSGETGRGKYPWSSQLQSCLDAEYVVQRTHRQRN